MSKINKITFLKYKKQIQVLYKLGKKYDKEKDPEKKELLKAEVIKRCNDLKPKLKLNGCSDEDAQNLLGVPVDTYSEKAEEKTAINEDADTNA